MSISLVVITDGLKMASLERTIKSASFVQERLILYQGSDMDVFDRMRAMSDFCYQTTPKGNADPDRNFTYTLPSSEWILALDDDEWVPDETASFIQHIVLSSADVVWFDFDNRVDGVDISDVLGNDPHPRLWRKRDGVINWPMRAHEYPQIGSPKQVFSRKKIVHDREYKDLLSRHESRKLSLDPKNVELEQRFLAAVKQKLNKR